MRKDVEKRWHGTISVHCPRFLDFLTPKRKGHISSLSVDQLLKTKVSIREIPFVQSYRREREYCTRDVCCVNVFSDRPSRSKKLDAEKQAATRVNVISKTPSSQPAKRQTCNKCPHPGQKCSFEQYTIPKPRPPMPPKRSSSLPKSVRALEIITRPSAPLSDFQLGAQEGQFFQILVTGAPHVFGCLSNTRLWPLVLQKCHTEPYIRHIALATSMAHEAQRGRDVPNLRCSARYHYARAVKSLNELLSNMKIGPDCRNLETILLASFMFTAFDGGRAYWWMQSSSMLLKTAMEMHRRKNGNSKLAGYLGELAAVFRRLDVKAISNPELSRSSSGGSKVIRGATSEMEIVRKRRLLRQLGGPSAFGRSERRKKRREKSGLAIGS